MENGSVAKSLAFKLSERFAVKGLGLLISIILARLLSPSEFGEIAIIMVFINLSISFVQSGLGTALVQNKDVTRKDYSTVFYISFALALFLVGILWFAAPFVGAFYENEALVLPLRVYSLSLIFCAFNTVQTAKLTREMAFGKQFWCNLVACVLSGILGCVLAYLGWGIWSLIIYYFSSTIITSVAMLLADRWWPGLSFSLSRAKVLFSYGWKMMIAAFLCSLYADIRTLIIGKRFSEEELGYYNRGHQFPEILSNTLDMSIQSVMFPVLSRSQDDREEMKRILRRTVTLSSFIVMPAMIGMASAAKPFICVALTQKWLPAVVFMQILCLGNLTLPITSSNLVAIKSTGKSGTYMILELVRRLAMLAVLLISVFVFGTVEMIAWGFVVSSIVDVIIVSFSTKRILNYSLFEQIGDLWKIFVCSVLMGACVFPLVLLPVPDIVVLLLQIIVGIASYIAFALLLRVAPIFDLISLLKRLICRSKANDKEV